MHPSRENVKAALAILVASVLSSSVVILLMQPHAGLGTSDEGLYLQSVAVVDPQSSWGFPWQWNLRGLWSISDQSVAVFRSVSISIAIVIGILVAIQLHAIANPKPLNVHSNPWLRRSSWMMCALIGAFAVLLYYFPYLRTPSYNWLILVGGLCFTLGFALFESSQKGSGLNRARGVLATLTMSLGLFLTIPAKPSVAPMLVALTCIGLLLQRGFGQAARWMSSIALAVLFWLLVALVTKQWPIPFHRPFVAAVSGTTPEEAQTILGALRALLSVPRSVVFGLPVVLMVSLAALIPFIALIEVLIRRRGLRPQSRLVVFAATALWFTVASNLLPLNQASGMARANWVDVPLGRALLAWTFVMLMWALITIRLAARGRAEDSVLLMLSLLLAVTPLVLAFGSGNDLVGQSARFGAGYVLSILVCSLVVFQSKALLWTLLFLVLTLGALTWKGLDEGRTSPYGLSGSISVQTHPVELPNTTHPVLVDTQTRKLIEGLSSGLPPLMERRRIQLLPLTFAWPSTIVFSLGFDSVDGLILGIPGSARFDETVAERLERYLGSDPEKPPWILLQQSDPKNGGEANYFEKLLVERFSDLHYCKVSEYDSFSIWKPSSESTCSIPVS